MESLDKDFAARAAKALGRVDQLLANKFGGDFGGRQPIHTCYVPADKFSSTVIDEWGQIALSTIERHTATPEIFARTIGVAPKIVEEIWPRLIAKIKTEPIEDLRIDFEDGYGRRGDSQEESDLQNVLTAFNLVKTPFIGIRIKSLESITRSRALKTLDQFISGLLAKGLFPANFTITLPKVTFVEQVEVMVLALADIEKKHNLPTGTIRFEIQIETTQAIIGPDGQVSAAKFIDACLGRLTGFHYGTYDYSAAAGISPAYQSLDHPVADFAKSILQVITAGTTVRISDGSTNILAVGATSAVHLAMHNHYRLVRRSLERGIYQGWDLHGSQIPTRIVANWIFYREGLTAAAQRLTTYLEKVESATMDEPATALTLARYFLRGLDCSAITPEEVAKLTGQNQAFLRQLVVNKGVI